MASQVISYRLSDKELEALEALSLPGESLSMTAQRLMKQLLENNSLSTEVSTVVDSELIHGLVEEKMQFLINSLNDQLGRIQDEMTELKSNNSVDAYKLLNVLKTKFPNLKISDII